MSTSVLIGIGIILFAFIAWKLMKALIAGLLLLVAMGAAAYVYMAYGDRPLYCYAPQSVIDAEIERQAAMLVQAAPAQGGLSVPGHPILSAIADNLPGGVRGMGAQAAVVAARKQVEAACHPKKT